jgi:hypothetical protein
MKLEAGLKRWVMQLPARSTGTFIPFALHILRLCKSPLPAVMTSTTWISPVGLFPALTVPYGKAIIKTRPVSLILPRE